MNKQAQQAFFFLFFLFLIFPALISQGSREFGFFFFFIVFFYAREYWWLKQAMSVEVGRQWVVNF